jgi:hypothetical protein
LEAAFGSGGGREDLAGMRRAMVSQHRAELLGFEA